VRNRLVSKFGHDVSFPFLSTSFFVNRPIMLRCIVRAIDRIVVNRPVMLRCIVRAIDRIVVNRPITLRCIVRAIDRIVK
jgi:hypothetical protein